MPDLNPRFPRHVSVDRLAITVRQAHIEVTTDGVELVTDDGIAVFVDQYLIDQIQRKQAAA